MIRVEHQKLTIINFPIPHKRNINADLKWLGSSLGLFNIRDKDKSMFRLFIELLKAAKTKIPISILHIADLCEACKIKRHSVFWLSAGPAWEMSS